MEKIRYIDPPEAEMIYRAVYLFDEEARKEILKHYQPIIRAKVLTICCRNGLGYDWQLQEDMTQIINAKLLTAMNRFS